MKKGDLVLIDWLGISEAKIKKVYDNHLKVRNQHWPNVTHIIPKSQVIEHVSKKRGENIG